MVSGDECVDPIEHISSGLRPICSIADVLPMPDSIDPVDKLDEDAAQGMGINFIFKFFQAIHGLA